MMAVPNAMMKVYERKFMCDFESPVFLCDIVQGGETRSGVRWALRHIT